MPYEFVAGQPDVGEHSGPVLVEMEECPRVPVEDAGSAFDEAVDAPEVRQQVADPLEAGLGRMPHDPTVRGGVGLVSRSGGSGRSRTGAGRPGAREGGTNASRRSVRSRDSLHLSYFRDVNPLCGP